jgi:hypothetical protein
MRSIDAMLHVDMETAIAVYTEQIVGAAMTTEEEAAEAGRALLVEKLSGPPEGYLYTSSTVVL